MIKIQTKFFGEIEKNEDEILYFPFGLYGFEDLTRFVLLHDIEAENEETGVLLRYLQFVDNPAICFTVMVPELIESDYSPKLPKDTFKKLRVTKDKEKDLIYFVICSIKENLEDSTANLLGPIVINQENRIGMQVILDKFEPENENYQIRHNIFKYYDDNNNNNCDYNINEADENNEDLEIRGAIYAYNKP